MATEARRLPDWGLEPTYPLARRVALVAINVAIYGALLGLVLWVTSKGDPALVGVIRIMWSGFALFWFIRAFSGPRFGTIGIGTAKIRALPEAMEPSVANLAGGLARDHKLQVPALYLIDSDAPNAIVFRKWGPALALTSGLVNACTRTELEAVLAHCLVRLNSRYFRFALLASVVPWGAGLAPKVGFEDDVHTVAMTRFPPGLASAIEKSKPIGKWNRPLWFVAEGPSHRPVPERIAALQDL